MSAAGISRIVFYGTLRIGESAYRQFALANRLRFVSTCIFVGRLFDLGDYPGFFHGEGFVTGDLFEADEPGLIEELDAYEGYDPGQPATSLFVRERIVLEAPRLEAFIYRFNGTVDGRRRISSGDWPFHRRARLVEAGL